MNGTQTKNGVHSVRTRAENRSFFNLTTTISLHSGPKKLIRQFTIIPIQVQALDADLILSFVITQTSSPIHMRMLIGVIRMLHTFVVMLVHRRNFQGRINLQSKIMKSGKLSSND